jgi:hypothetical protein
MNNSSNQTFRGFKSRKQASKWNKEEFTQGNSKPLAELLIGVEEVSTVTAIAMLNGTHIPTLREEEIIPLENPQESSVGDFSINIDFDMGDNTL